MDRAVNLVLCGFMGCGKSTIARLVAERTGRTLFDTDAWIEEREGTSVARLFAARGEPYFRAIERRAVARAAALRRAVVATGGGVPLDPGNVFRLSTTGILVCLTAPPAELFRRLAGDPARPLASGLATTADVARKLAERAPFYAAIPRQIAAHGRSVEAVADELVGLVEG